MSRIFINYRSSDTAAMAEILDERLAAHFGRAAVFRDDAVIPIGIDYRKFLWSHLALTEVMLVLIGPHWFEKDTDGVTKLFKPVDFVRMEIEVGLNSNMKVVPILVAGRGRIEEADLPKEIKDLAFRQYRHIRDRNSGPDIASLIKAIESVLPPAPGQDPAPPLRPATPPPGGRSITIGDVKNDGGAMSFGDHSPASNVNGTSSPQPRDHRETPAERAAPGSDGNEQSRQRDDLR